MFGGSSLARARMDARTDRPRAGRGPRPLPPLTPGQESALVLAVNEARRCGPGVVTAESDSRGGLRLTRPAVEYVAGLELDADRVS